MCTLSFTELVNFDICRNISILEYARLTNSFVFISPLRLLVIMVPSNLISFTVSIFFPFNTSLVENCLFLLMLNIIHFVFSSLRIIFWFSVHFCILFRNFWDFRFFGGMTRLLTLVSFGTWFLLLCEAMPIRRKFIFSSVVRSSTNENLELFSTQFALLFDQPKYTCGHSYMVGTHFLRQI